MISRMSDVNRREFGVLAAFAALSGVVSEAQAGGKLSQSTVFKFDKLVAKTNAVGGTSRAVVSGNVATGEFIEVHESTLEPGQMPHPPHKHANSELILLRAGQVDYLTDGGRQAVVPGDVIFTASNQPHGMINTGKVTASYYVVSIGVQPGSTPVELKVPV